MTANYFLETNKYFLYCVILHESELLQIKYRLYIRNLDSELTEYFLLILNNIGKISTPQTCSNILCQFRNIRRDKANLLTLFTKIWPL